jgi:futalosine hydrolase
MHYYFRSMPLKVLLVTATNAEAEPITNLMLKGSDTNMFRFRSCEINTLITGVGGISTAWSLARWFSRNELPAIVINAGIAGSFRSEISPGTVVIPVSECFADSGIETPEGFKTLFEAGLEDPDRFPFSGGRLIAGNRYVSLATKRLKAVNAITVNTVSGSTATVERLMTKFDPDIETMEGATFFYICIGEKVPFLAFRAVSNLVETRNRNKWEIPLALYNLAEEVREFILTLEKDYEN